MKLKRTSSAGGAILIALLAIIASCSAFLSPVGKQQSLRLRPGDEYPNLHGIQTAAPPRRDVSVGLFRNLLKKIKGDDDDEDEQSKAKDELDVVDSGKIGDATTPIESSQGKDAATPIEQTALEIVKEEAGEESPRSTAQKLRRQAAIIRLEADKRQVQLTLEKIEKVNSKLEHMKTLDTVDAKDQQSLEEELERLKSQLVTDESTGEIKPVSVPVVVAAKSESVAAGATTSSPAKADSTLSRTTPTPSRPSMSAEDMQERVRRFQDAPEFMKILVAKTVGFTVDDNTPGAVDRLNATDIVQKMYDDEIDYESITVESDFADDLEKEKARSMIERAYANSNDDDNDKPVFTEEQLQAKVKELEDIPQFLKNMVEKEFNDTQIAAMLLEEEWREEQRKKKGGGGFFDLFGGDDDKEKGKIGRDGESMDRKDPGSFSRLFSDEADGTSRGKSDLSFMMESLYPKSTRKEDETPDKRQVDAFVNDVVAPTKAFTPQSNPISVPGGWVSQI